VQILNQPLKNMVFNRIFFYLGLFTKAKGRFLGRDEFQGTSNSYSSHYSLQVNNTTPVWEPQEFGD